MNPAIQVSGLHKTYGKTKALQGLDFEIPTGKVTGFLGPNGSGKTTTFRAILGLTRPDEGNMEILGMTSPDSLAEITKRIGCIVEEPGLLRPLSGRVNLRVAADTLGFGHDRIDEMLQFVGLTEDAGRRAEQYSKGMRQRLALAAAMLGDPELLILDEPLDGLDPAGQHVFKAKLRALADQGKTVVISSHNLADVEELADYVVVINEGVLVNQGPLDEMLGSGGTRVTVPDPGVALPVLTAAGITARVDGDTLVVEGGEGSTIVRVLGSAGIYPSEVRPDRNTLERVFLGMTVRGEE
jgi:ABC-type multidrug transport system ATPase subunit